MFFFGEGLASGFLHVLPGFRDSEATKTLRTCNEVMSSPQRTPLRLEHDRREVSMPWRDQSVCLLSMGTHGFGNRRNWGTGMGIGKEHTGLGL